MPPLLRADFSNLLCLYSTFRLEYPLVLSRFCLIPNNGINHLTVFIIHLYLLFVPDQHKVCFAFNRGKCTFLDVNTHIPAQFVPVSTLSQTKNYKSELYSLGHSLIYVDKLTPLLFKYPDKNVANPLLDGFKCGFYLNYQGPRRPMCSRNLKFVL